MEQFHGTTILTVRRGTTVAMAGDGQVSLGDTVMKGNARKVRRLRHGPDPRWLCRRYSGRLHPL